MRFRYGRMIVQVWGEPKENLPNKCPRQISSLVLVLNVEIMSPF